MRVGNTTAAGTAPTDANTVELLDTYTALNRIGLSAQQITKYLLTVSHSHDGTVRLSKSRDGTTYDIFEVRAVPAPVSPLVASPLDFDVQGVDYLKVQWVNGGTTQTTWRPDQELVERDRA